MQPTLNHQMMGYDRSSTMFSPDGRLLQVEYAKKSVRQGTTSIGIVCKDGTVLIADKRVTEKLMIGESIEKVFKVDDHIGASVTGILADGRVLVEKAQLIAQQHNVTYDSSIDLLSLVKDIANLKQAYSQFGGARPFGVSILFAGVDDNGPQLFVTDVTGMYFQYKATAVGESEQQVKEILEKEYAENMDIEDGIRLGISALKRVFGKDFDPEKLDCAYVSTKDKLYTKLEKEQLKKIGRKS